MDLQAEKDIVRNLHLELDGSAPEAAAETLSRHVRGDYLWRGPHPFHVLNGPDGAGREFWGPLREAFSSLHRRDDIFFAGRNRIDGGRSIWVVSMGHLVGLFDRSWLGIPPTGRMAFLRHCTFHRVEEGRVVETAMQFDIPHLMVQAGLRPFPPETGVTLVQPGPATHDGLLHGPQPPKEGERTLDLIDAMISDLGTWNLGLPLEDELRRSWHEDMTWWGPTGIGATCTIPRYAAQHSGVFRRSFADRSATAHVARLAEGDYGGFFGWPNFTARPTGGFMGMPATDKAGEFRVIDIYRRAGDRLAENWIFIDLLHFWNMQGVDILARTAGLRS